MLGHKGHPLQRATMTEQDKFPWFWLFVKFVDTKLGCNDTLDVGIPSETLALDPFRARNDHLWLAEGCACFSGGDKVIEVIIVECNDPPEVGGPTTTLALAPFGSRIGNLWQEESSPCFCVGHKLIGFVIVECNEPSEVGDPTKTL